MTTPDQTIYKEFYATSGWQRGLTTRTEAWSGGALKKYTTTAWEQDNPAVGYQLNPRPVETNVHDDAGNRRRTTVAYTSFGLPSEVKEFKADGVAVLRRTVTEYNLDAAYTSRRVIGLVSARLLYDENGALQSKVGYLYDEGGEFLQGLPTAAARHDATNYGAGFVTGRGLLTAVRRYDVNNPTQYVESKTAYNVAGSVAFSRDPRGHQTTIGYADKFVDPNNPNDPNATISYNTYAYPTTVTDADNYSSATQYNYEMGAVWRTQDPKGAAARSLYDAAGRVVRAVNLTSGAYARWYYPSHLKYAEKFTTVADGGGEDYSVEFFNGLGKVRMLAGYHHYSAGGWRMQWFEYDVMGRARRQTDVTEITGAWQPAGDDAAGARWTEQSYDWMGRPLVTTNLSDGTTKEVSYGSCGCAGGAVTTVRDEVGRRERVTQDVLGRAAKTELLNMDGTVYSTTTNEYNARDQVTRVYRRQGSSGAGQETLMTYDGHGRLLTSKAPVQSSPVTYTYDTDDVVLATTDPRGVVTTFGFTNAAGYTNKRHLVNSVTYSNAPQGVPVPSPVRYEYDEAGNRTQMTDGTGGVSYSYNTLSQLTSETRTFAGLSGGYTVSYGYSVSGQLKYVTDPSGSRADYAYDPAGRLLAVTGSGAHSVSSYASNLRYRAWGALRDIDYGNGTHSHTDYNARRLATGSALSNVYLTHANQNATMSWTYDYYADGRVNHAYDVQDDRFDRRYDYDHAGRLKEAYTGREARGQAASTPYADSPYRQTTQYDVWGNVTSKAGRFWRRQQSDSATYTDDRRQYWTYDAAGNVLSGDGKAHTYDAAGEQTLAAWDVVGGGETGNPQRPAVEIAQTYGGDGRPAKRVETRRTKEYVGEGPQTTVTETATTTYYVHSGVLGGSKLVELDGVGAKAKGYVYASGGRLRRRGQRDWWMVTSGHGDPEIIALGIEYMKELTEQAAKRTAGQKCDDKLAAIFGDGSVVGTTHDPSTLTKANGERHGGAGRPRLGDEDIRNGVMHIYTDARGSMTTAYLYTPDGFAGRPISGPKKNQGQSGPELSNYHRFTYLPGSLQKQFGYAGGLAISFNHVGPTRPDGTPYMVDRSERNGMKSVRVGIIGGFGNVPSVGGVSDGYTHTHTIFYSVDKDGETIGKIDPRRVFCKEYGF